MATESDEQAPRSVIERMHTFIAFISAVVGVVAAVQAFGSKAAADKSAEEALAFKHALESQANERAERETKAKFDAIAYEAVVKVIEMDRNKIPADVAEKRERAVLALIAATATASMQTVLFEVVRTGPSVTASVKKDAGQAADVLRDVGSLASDAANVLTSSASAQSTPAKGIMSAASLKGYRVVIFYCQNSSNPRASELQRSVAATLVDELRSSPPLTALDTKWEIKELPEVLNSSHGYRVFTNQIRFNPLDDEDSASIALKMLLESTTTLQKYTSRLERRTVGQRTPRYLSLFLCGLQTAS